jgi:hypothetical protein
MRSRGWDESDVRQACDKARGRDCGFGLRDWLYSTHASDSVPYTDENTGRYILHT